MLTLRSGVCIVPDLHVQVEIGFEGERTEADSVCEGYRDSHGPTQSLSSKRQRLHEKWHIQFDPLSPRTTTRPVDSVAALRNIVRLLQMAHASRVVHYLRWSHLNVCEKTIDARAGRINKGLRGEGEEAYLVALDSS